MWNEGNRFGMKQMFIVLASFCIISQISCDQSMETSSRKKRDYNNSPYSTSYTTNPYDSEYQSLKCGIPPKCLPISAIPNQDDPVKTNKTWLAIPRTFYQTGDSCWGYSLFAKILLGRDVRGEQELREMCLTQQFANVGFCIIDGYGSQFAQNCVGNDINAELVCTTVAGSGTEGTNLSFENVEVDYLILTNSKSFVLYYRCVDNRYADYMLFTTRPFVERADAVEVVDTIRSMGLDVNELRFLQCAAPRYPYPFQNYPNEYSYPTCSNSYQSGQSQSPANNEAYNRPPTYDNHGNYYGPPPALHYPPNY